jgi:amidase
VQALLDAGASLIGKTITDEISLGILGESAFDGTPLNAKAPDRVPGGSSSGSAAAVAAGLCDCALGSDTGGSVRVPASFCGLYGIRPSHGRMNMSGVMVQAPGSDTAGWLARDAATFARVSEVMLEETIPDELPTRLIVASDLFSLADDAVADALMPLVDALSELCGEAWEDTLAPPGLSHWAQAQRALQPAEAWQTFKDWIDRDNPRFAFSVARNLVMGSMITEEQLKPARLVRLEARARMKLLLPPGTILCLPTTPYPALPKGLSISEQDDHRERLFCFLAHGGLTGVPQISIPGAEIDGLPVGLSILGGAGTDAALVAVARALSGNT